MKLMNHEKVSDSVLEMELKIEADEFREAVSTVYKRTAKNYNVPGFRKGRAPRNLIEKMYGDDVFTVDAVNEIFPDVLNEAYKELNVEPVAQPNAEIVSSSRDEGVVLKIEVKIVPEIEIGDYTGLKADRIVDKVDDADVQREIENMREGMARILTREEGKAEDGDIVTIDYAGSVDGEEFVGGTDTGAKLTLGSGQFIPGFEEQVVGHETGDEFDVNVTFPESYQADELAGKDAVFAVKLDTIQYKELPELDDEFAKDVSEFDTLKELEDHTRENIQKELDNSSDVQMENKLVEQIVETIKGEIPEEMYENRTNEMLQEFNMQLQQQGFDLGTYLQYLGQDVEEFRAGFRKQAEKAVEMRLALQTVGRLEGFDVTEEELEKELEKIGKSYQMDAEQVRNMMPIDEIEKDILVNKALKHVVDNAKITEIAAEDVKEEADDKKDAEEEAEKKPAKKAEKKPAKKEAAKKEPAKKATKKPAKKEAAKKEPAKKAAAKKEPAKKTEKKPAKKATDKKEPAKKEAKPKAAKKDEKVDKKDEK